MAARRRCPPKGRRADYSARVLSLLSEYPDQEFSTRQIAQEVGSCDPHSIIFLTLLVVRGQVSCLRRSGAIYYRKA